MQSKSVREIPAVIPDKRRKLPGKLRRGRPTTFVERRTAGATACSPVKSGNMMHKGASKFLKAPVPPQVIQG